MSEHTVSVCLCQTSRIALLSSSLQALVCLHSFTTSSPILTSLQSAQVCLHTCTSIAYARTLPPRCMSRASMARRHARTRAHVTCDQDQVTTHNPQAQTQDCQNACFCATFPLHFLRTNLPFHPLIKWSTRFPNVYAYSHAFFSLTLSPSGKSGKT